jgi:putative SOS response-associated peptidase YedK
MARRESHSNPAESILPTSFYRSQRALVFASSWPWQQSGRAATTEEITFPWYFDAAKDSDMVFYRIRVGTRNLNTVARLKPHRARLRQEIGSNPSPAWQTDSPKKSKARLLVLSEKLQFPSIGHTRCTIMLEKQIDEIR